MEWILFAKASVDPFINTMNMKYKYTKMWIQIPNAINIQFMLSSTEPSLQACTIKIKYIFHSVCSFRVRLSFIWLCWIQNKWSVRSGTYNLLLNLCNATKIKFTKCYKMFSWKTKNNSTAGSQICMKSRPNRKMMLLFLHLHSEH